MFKVLTGNFIRKTSLKNEKRCKTTFAHFLLQIFTSTSDVEIIKYYYTNVSSLAIPFWGAHYVIIIFDISSIVANKNHLPDMFQQKYCGTSTEQFNFFEKLCHQLHHNTLILQ